LSELEKLGSSLFNALQRLVRTPIVDEAAVKELVRDIQRSLLQADVNVQLVLDLTKRMEDRALKESLPPGISRHQHIVKIVYDELTKFLGEKPAKIDLKPEKTNVLMLVGIQGSGKTTSAVKLARFFQRRGFKSALVCADTYRPGAYAQLNQTANRVNISVYGKPEENDPVKIALEGVKKFEGESYQIVVVDTAGRHKDEKSLMDEMREIAGKIKPDETILIIDSTIGQRAAVQAKAFHEATDIGSIFVAKLDGSARGGGALSAVAATMVPIKFIGTGEKIDDIEPFEPARFVGRLLGMGDLQGLVQKVREAGLKVPERRMRAFFSGRFTLADMYEEIETVQRMGPFGSILGKIPGLGYKIPKEFADLADEKTRRWRYIIQSMTDEEKNDPKILNPSRIRRVAWGSGTSEREVKELVNQFFTMRKMMKMIRRKRIPFLQKFPGQIK